MTARRKEQCKHGPEARAAPEPVLKRWRIKSDERRLTDQAREGVKHARDRQEGRGTRAEVDAETERAQFGKNREDVRIEGLEEPHSPENLCQRVIF